MNPIVTIHGLTMYSPINEVTGLPVLWDLLALPQPPNDATEETWAASAARIGVQPDQLREAWEINKQDFIDYLCIECMGMSVAYPDAAFLRNAIGTWSRVHLPEWQQLFDSCFLKFNPLWNKDGTIKETGSDAKTNEYENDGESNPGSTSTTTDQVKGYDGGNWADASKSITTGSGQDTSHSEGGYTDTITYGHITTEQGNIGVTKSTELLDDFRNTVKWSIEDYIVREFKRQFCLQIW